MLETFYNDLKEEMSAKDILSVILIGCSIGALVIGLLLFEQ